MTVFLTSVLISMIMAGMVFVHAGRSIASAGYCDAVLTLAGRSVLSEFDRRLKDEYGLFAFYGLENQIESTIRFYANSSFQKQLPYEIFKKNDHYLNVYKLKLENVKANLAPYALADVDVFEEQIVSYMNYLMAEKGISFVKDMWGKAPKANSSEGRLERTLKNQAEINSLPSKGNMKNGIDIAAILETGLPSFSKILDEGTKLFRVNEYILSHFKYRTGGDKSKNSFFEYEVEYILYGKKSDEENRKAFRGDFVILRTTLNVAHIYMCPQKLEETLALAEIMTPGPAAIATQLVLIGLWGAAEAENDARLLESGHAVPLLKTDQSWALDLESAVKNVFRNKPMGLNSDEGYSYADYLRLFLYLERRDTKLLRMMDLIQLNFRGSYYDDFLLKNHYVGYSMEVSVSGKKYSYEQKY